MLSTINVNNMIQLKHIDERNKIPFYINEQTPYFTYRG